MVENTILDVHDNNCNKRITIDITGNCEYTMITIIAMDEISVSITRLLQTPVLER